MPTHTATVQQMVADAALAYGLNPIIFFTQMQGESGFNPGAVGAAGEIGVAQFMPATWTRVILQHPELQEPPFNATSDPAGRSNVLANIYAAAAHMADLLASHGGTDYWSALRDYNGSGPAAEAYATGVLGRAATMTQEDQEFADALGGAGGGGDSVRLVTGMTLVNLDTGERVQIAVSTDNRSGSPVLTITNATGTRLLEGFWATLDGSAFQLARGQIAGAPRPLTVAERVEAGLPGATSADIGGRSVAEEIELLQFQHDLAVQRGDHDRAEDFKNQIAILKKQQDFTFKLDRLDALDNLTTTILGLQQQARTSGIEAIGRDPFRGAIQAQGGTAIGRSPFERLRQQQLDFAEAEIPSVGAGAGTTEVQAAIDEAQGLIRNIPQRPIGLRHGGNVTPIRGGFVNTDTGEVGDSLIVGESGAERIDMSNGLITVTPQAKRRRGGLRAEHGGTFSLTDPIDAPTQPGGGFGVGTEQFGEEALSRAQAIFPLFEALGFSEVPLINRQATGGLGDVLGGPSLGTGLGGFGTPESFPRPGDPSDIFTQLGTRPRLIFDPNLGLFFQVNENTGELQILGDIATAVSQFHINPSDAVTMTVEEVQQSGFNVDPAVITAGGFGPGTDSGLGGPLGAPLQRQESLLGSGRGRFSELNPLIAPLDIGQTVGILLPDPRMIAAVWNDLDIRTQDAVFSAYGLAGFNEAQLEERIRFFTPQGGQTARGGGRVFNQRAGRVASAAGLPSSFAA